jgi:Fe-S-cluster containining protein
MTVQNQTTPIRVLEEGKPAHTTGGLRPGVIGLELEISGQRRYLRIAVNDQRAGLADIVPVARQICGRICGLVTASSAEVGEPIACRRGCAACCHHLVPVSVPEALRLSAEILSMPEPRDKLVQRKCLLTARRILRRRPPGIFAADSGDGGSDRDSRLETISRWYRNLQVVCPFLEDGLCTIYPIRPLVCREYFVKGSEKTCAGGCVPQQVLAMPVRIGEVLGLLASELEGTSVEVVMLPLVLVWHELSRNRGCRTWPAAMMVRRLVELVKQSCRHAVPT